MQRIALAGVKHTGKTTKGKLLCDTRGGSFRDLDDLITEKLPRGYTIRQWYKEKGQQAFRKMEVLALQEYLSSENSIFSCLALGGATLENEKARSLLIKASVILCGIEDEEDVLYRRILEKGLPPFLETEDPRQTFHKMYKTRSATIRRYCNITISCKGLTLEESVDKLDREIRNYTRTLVKTGD